jgi:serine/threonine protein kinase
MEYCEGSLEDQLREAENSKKPLPMTRIKNFARQIFNGLA